MVYTSSSYSEYNTHAIYIRTKCEEFIKQKGKAQTYRFVILLSLVALTTTGVCCVCCWYGCCLAGEQTTDFCFEACLYRLRAKNNANTAFKRPVQMSLVVIESKPPTFDLRNTFRHEFTLSYWNIKIDKVSEMVWKRTW